MTDHSNINLRMFFITLQVVASQDWPEVTKYAGLVSAQSHRQELIEDLYKVTQDPQRGTICGGMIRYSTMVPMSFLLSVFFTLSANNTGEGHICRELLISFKKSTGQKPQRILFYRCELLQKLCAHALMQNPAVTG